FHAEDGIRDFHVTGVQTCGLPISGGLVLVDTPGVGGLGSAHGAATMAAVAGADAVVFVSDAAQEYTRPELDFLASAMQMCPNVEIGRAACRERVELRSEAVHKRAK